MPVVKLATSQEISLSVIQALPIAKQQNERDKYMEQTSSLIQISAFVSL